MRKGDIKMKKLNLSEAFTIHEEVLQAMMNNQYEDEYDYKMSVIGIERKYGDVDSLYVHVTDNESDEAIMFNIKNAIINSKEETRADIYTMCEDECLCVSVKYKNKDELFEQIKKVNTIVFNRGKALFLECKFAVKFKNYLYDEYIFNFDKNIDNYKIHNMEGVYNYIEESNQIEICLACLFKDEDGNHIERRYIYIIVKAHEDGKVDLLYMDKYKKRKETLTLDKDALCMLINSYIQS